MKHLVKFNEKVDIDIRNIVDTIFVDLYDQGFTISLLDKFELVKKDYWTSNWDIPGITLNITKWNMTRTGRRQTMFNPTEINESVSILLDYMKRKFGPLAVEYVYHTKISRKYDKAKDYSQKTLPNGQIMRLWVKIRKDDYKKTELKLRMP